MPLFKRKSQFDSKYWIPKMLALTVNILPSAIMAIFMFTLAFLNEKDKAF